MRPNRAGLAVKPLQSALQPVQHSTIHEKVYGEIRQALMAGQFAPGQKITVRELAEVLGVSPMPVREALRRLEAERGLVADGRTMAVPLMSQGDYRELCDIRISLEGMATEWAAENITPAELDELKAVMDGLERDAVAPNIEGLLRLNREFHMLVYRASRKPLLIDLIQSLWLRVGPFISYAVRTDIYTSFARHNPRHPHVLAYQALVAGNGRQARSAIAADIRRSAQIIVKHLPA